MKCFGQIKSHDFFQVISSDGLTKNRLEILQKLLNELSNCDEEAKFAVEALQSILSELQPQGKKFRIK